MPGARTLPSSELRESSPWTGRKLLEAAEAEAFEKRRAPAFALGRHSFLATLVKESQSFSESEQGPVRSVEVGQAEDGG